MIALTAIAAHTTTVRLATGVNILPQTNPLYLAKQAASLDYASKGRFMLGVGIGWLREEFEALGVPWAHRAQRTRECLGVMKTLWCDEVSRYKGEFFQLPDCLQNPKPVQKPHPPIHFGGESDAALQRVADIGQGWYGFNLTPDKLTERLAQLDRFLSDAGRSRQDLFVSVAPYRQRASADDVRRYQDLGIDQLIVGFFGRDVDGLERAADRIAELAG